MALGEFELIDRFFRRQAEGEGVILGVGDDCALLQLPPGRHLVTTLDTLVEGNHFPRNAEPELIAERALRVNLSDIAAMGAEPLWFSLGLTLPNSDEDWLESFSRGLFRVAGEFGCTLVGGDTTRGPLTVTIQVMATSEPGRALLRSGAQAGDRVYVTGTLGDAAAAVALLNGVLEPGREAADYLMERYYRPRPQLAEGQMLRGVASAAIDVSDGLLADLGHICEASGVAATVAVEQLPLSPALRGLPEQQAVRNWALSGGDDYQLCFTVPPTGIAGVENLLQDGKLAATAVGNIVAGRGLTCTYRGRDFAPEKTGYQHFDANNDNA